MDDEAHALACEIRDATDGTVDALGVDAGICACMIIFCHVCPNGLIVVVSEPNRLEWGCFGV